ncbi:FAD-dependent oxidoreductase [Cyanobium sp. ATX 6A2]|uniref:FAD-dependent oxidoreductase n=1 Tax=Cyanobium sp. ATX 6A2 TaxID=2823700 RepID=UPI0020CCF908|nr:FAD-dependent oxidoreductase [Cyanobium sp. ATX 6A2]MCP9887200.1 FAD-dependent oxidoreductase [Cyanobium sp. ATX 6A2]
MSDQQLPVVVWGGGTGGAAAAIQAGRAGARTLLLTPGPWLGGMVSAAGVCCPDGNELSPWQTGLWGALLRQLAAEEPEGLDHNWVSCFGYRPARAEAILRRWLQAAGVEWWPHCRLRAVCRRGDRIALLELERWGKAITVAPQLAIDGSDRGELMALAGSAHRFGWESRELWQEPSAPPASRLAAEPFFTQQPVQSPTWVAMGRLRHDRRCPDPAPHPAAPFAAATEAFGLERTITYGRLPGDLVMLNWPLHGNDWHSGLERAFSSAGCTAAAAADAEAQLFAAMQEHSLAFAAALEQASAGWLEPAPVFPQAAGAAALEGPSPLALMPYWREGRRLEGLVTVTEQHLLPAGSGACIAPLGGDGGALDAIAVGNYANDHHYPGADWPLAPKSCRWGGRWSGTPFTIPYGALVSRDTSNLLAADKCFSVSHMANGATRLQPLILNIGQAAGLAAALCLQRGCSPAELPVRDLQQALIADALAPAAPLPLWDTPWHHPAWRRRQQAVLDDPGLLDVRGELAGSQKRPGALEADLDPTQAPATVHEQLWSGALVGDGQGGFRLETGADSPAGASRSWPLITLEPAVHHWLGQEADAAAEGPVRLLAVANPWGPWLRVTRLQAPATSRS